MAALRCLRCAAEFYAWYEDGGLVVSHDPSRAGIPSKLVGIVKRIRAPIDRALDKIVARLARTLDKLVAKAKETATKLLAWWKKKVPIRGGSEPHTLTFTGQRKAAKLVVMSAPEKPSVFVTREATKAGKFAEASGHIADAQGREVGIEKTQQELAAFDDKPAKAAAADSTTADKKSADLERQLGDLAITIGKAVATFAVDEVVAGVDLPREVVTIDAQGKEKTRQMANWTKSQNAGVKQEHEWMGGDSTLHAGAVVDRHTHPDGQEDAFVFTESLWLWDARQPGTWTFVTVPAEVSQVLDDLAQAAGPRAGFGSIKVEARIGASEWHTSVFPDTASGCFVLPVKRSVREANGVEAGDSVTVRLRALL